MRPSLPVISPVPVPVPVKAALLVLGATALPEALVTIETAGAVTTPLKALPSWPAADKSSVRLSGVRDSVPVFSINKV